MTTNHSFMDKKRYPIIPEFGSIPVLSTRPPKCGFGRTSWQLKSFDVIILIDRLQQTLQNKWILYINIYYV